MHSLKQLLLSLQNISLVNNALWIPPPKTRLGIYYQFRVDAGPICRYAPFCRKSSVMKVVCPFSDGSLGINCLAMTLAIWLQIQGTLPNSLHISVSHQCGWYNWTNSLAFLMRLAIPMSVAMGSSQPGTKLNWQMKHWKESVIILCSVWGGIARKGLCKNTVWIFYHVDKRIYPAAWDKMWDKRREEKVLESSYQWKQVPPEFAQHSPWEIGKKSVKAICQSLHFDTITP